MGDVEISDVETSDKRYDRRSNALCSANVLIFNFLRALPRYTGGSQICEISPGFSGIHDWCSSGFLPRFYRGIFDRNPRSVWKKPASLFETKKILRKYQEFIETPKRHIWRRQDGSVILPVFRRRICPKTDGGPPLTP